MNSKVLPFALALIAIVSLSLFENIYIKDRWGEPGAEAAQLGQKFVNVPLNIGEWQGEELPMDERIAQRAGAVNYVSRSYTHATTGRKVVLWLMVGHARDIWRHTPDRCYPASGFHSRSKPLPHYIELEGDETAGFYTAKYEKEDGLGRSIERVFWTFSHPERGTWDAPERGPRLEYGIARAIYKLYFTSSVHQNEDTIEESPAIDFAEVMLPEIHSALYGDGAATPSTEVETDVTASDTTPGEENAS